MKKLILFLPILILFSCAKEKDSVDKCIDPSAINPDLNCYMVYDPVCGCDGKTYGNDCMATVNGVQHFTQGACGCEYPFSGIVQDYGNTQGCGVVIVTNDGKLVEPVNLPANVNLRIGDLVHFNYREITAHPSGCAGAAMADIFCIRQSSCLPLEKPSLNFSPMVDQIHINNASINGDCLLINYSYSGGCSNHDFELRPMFIDCATPPLPPATLQFVHDAHGDLCQAYITEEKSYDISSLQEQGKNSIPIVLIDYHGQYNQQLTYNY